ncbi:MAG TPA: DUF4838 domain-containing protein [Armatimonadota bacterium]|jgi:hypothetical protein
MAPTVLLAADGKALAAVLVPPDADRVTRFAARELARYLQQISGARFRVREATAPVAGQPALLVGAGPWTADLTDAPAPEPGGRDSFTLLTRDGKVYLWGNRSRATLYAVYAFLEALGCEFIEPNVEHIPGSLRLAAPELSRRETAGFALRNIFRNMVVAGHHEPFSFLNPDLHLPQIDWMAKRRLNHYEFYIDFYRYDLWEKHKHQVLDALLDRGFDLEVTHHSLHYFCPPDENHDFGGYGPSTYQRNHPNWYEPAYECGSRGRWQTNVGIPAVQEVVFERYLDYVARNPELKIIGLWPDDVPMNAPYKGLSRTDGYVKFWNKLAKLMAKQHPDKRLGIIAYFELIEPPAQVEPLPNTHLWYCPIERNYMQPVSYPANRSFARNLQGWINQMAPGHLASFEYWGWAAPMTPHRVYMATDLPRYQEMGSGGIYGWAGFTYNLLGKDYGWAIDMFALSRLLWEPQADLTALEQQWARGVFGPAAGPVLDFYEIIKAGHAQEAAQGLLPSYEWISANLFHRAQKPLATARKKTDDPRLVRRIDQLEKRAALQFTEEVWHKRPPVKYVGM